MCRNNALSKTKLTGKASLENKIHRNVPNFEMLRESREVVVSL